MAISSTNASGTAILLASVTPGKLKIGSRANSAYGSNSPAGVASDVLSLSTKAVLRISQEALESHVGKQLEASFAFGGVQLSDALGFDWSPEATAERIVDFATGMFGVWKNQNQDMSEEELQSSFEKTIRGSIDMGYMSAMDFLGEMEVGEEHLDISKATILLVGEKLDTYFAKLRASASEEQSADDSTQPEN